MNTNKALDIRGYKFEPKMALTTRAAHYLNWAAEHFPKQFTPYNVLVKAIMGYAKMPRLESEEVEKMRSGMSRVRQILRTKYQRDLFSVPGVGVRATTDDADVAQTTLPRQSRHLKSAQASFVLTANLCDASNIPDTPEFAQIKKWVKTDVKGILAAITDPNFEKKLLPPASPTMTLPVSAPKEE